MVLDFQEQGLLGARPSEATMYQDQPGLEERREGPSSLSSALFLKVSERPLPKWYGALWALKGTSSCETSFGL